MNGEKPSSRPAHNYCRPRIVIFILFQAENPYIYSISNSDFWFVLTVTYSVTWYDKENIKR